MNRGRFVVGLLAIALVAGPGRALETDQFYAWKRELKDSTDAINEKVNAEVAEALARVNARHVAAPCPCSTAEAAIRDHFNYLIIAPPELWATKTSLVDRIPATPDEEPLFRRQYLYGATYSLDRILWMPPSPTIEIAGVRTGADKLGHFFSDGAWIEEAYRHARDKGAADDEAVRKALRFSIATERTIWGGSSSGIVSLGDLEANYQGLLFYRGLCGGTDPALAVSRAGWRLKRPIDLRDYVTPEWDESWQPNILTRSRWAKVKPVMERYCGLLRDPEIQRQRAAYAARDRETPTEAMIRELVAAGKLADPLQFTIEAACGLPPRAGTPGSSR